MFVPGAPAIKESLTMVGLQTHFTLFGRSSWLRFRFFVCTCAFFMVCGCTTQGQQGGRDYVKCTTAKTCAVTLRDVISRNIRYAAKTPLDTDVLLDIYQDDATNVASVVIRESSGSRVFDAAVVRGIHNSAPFLELTEMPTAVYQNQFTMIKLIFNADVIPPRAL